MPVLLWTYQAFRPTEYSWPDGWVYWNQAPVKDKHKSICPAFFSKNLILWIVDHFSAWHEGTHMITPMKHETMADIWNGRNRRSRYDRRIDNDRRSLLRFETIGCDRRLGTPRRKDEMLWEKAWIPRSDHV
jgi:hypothetical protein